MENIARHVIVTFRGAAAPFRFETLFQADARRLAGWVQDLPGGRMEALLEGPRSAVEGLIAWLHVGPSEHSVYAVEIRPRSLEGIAGFHAGERQAELVG